MSGSCSSKCVMPSIDSYHVELTILIADSRLRAHTSYLHRARLRARTTDPDEGRDGRRS